MGLDNGIRVRGIPNEDIPSIVIFPFDYFDTEDLFRDICYWRKCWGLRGEINSLLHLPKDEYETKVDREDIPAIMRIIKKFLKPAYWEENADSIWEYDEIADSLIQQLINLNWLYNYMEDHPNVALKWYDSY